MYSLKHNRTFLVQLNDNELQGSFVVLMFMFRDN